MTNIINNTNNPLIILACIALMITRHIAGLALAAAVAVARFVAEHYRIMLVIAGVIVAIPVTILAVNALLPVIVAVAGKALAGGVGTAAFALWARP